MTTPPSPAAELAVFAYGTLKQGFENHAHYCRGVSQVLPARAWGRLHLWEPGIPILAVPRERVLLLGSPDVTADLEAETAFADPAKSARRMPSGGRWRHVHGQLLLFPDAASRLRLLDALEGFHPRTGARSYERVLLSVDTLPSPYGAAGPRGAWCYVVPHDEDPPGPALDTDDWDPGRA